MSDKKDLIITALQQRIGEIVTNYETQVAILRAELTEIVDKQKEAEEFSNSLVESIEGR